MAGPPLHPRLHPPGAAPAGCDWLIQTHLQRNACLRVLVGVQFKSAAPGARGRAGAGSKDDSCAGASPRAAVGSLKRVFGRGKRLQKDPPSGSSAPIFNRSDARPPPIPILLQPDFGREQNPKRPHRSPGPSPHQTGKVKIRGTGTATCHTRPPHQRLGNPGGAPAAPQTPFTPLHHPAPPPPASISPGLQTPSRPRGVCPAKVQGNFQKRDDCGERREWRGVPGPGRPPAALNLPRGCVSAGPTWSLATRRIGGGGGCARPAAARPSVRPWGRGRGLGGGGAGRGRRGEEGGRRRRREGPGRSGRGPPGAGRHLFRVFPRIIDVPLM